MEKFLPTKDYHVFKITGLSVKDIKQSVKKCKKDRKIFKQSTALTFVAKQFGIKKGFSAYQTWYDNELEPFMIANGLLQYRDLTQNHMNEGLPFFTHKQIADRLYFSKKPIPKRIFTGHSFKSRFVVEEIASDFLFDTTYETKLREVAELKDYSTEELKQEFAKTNLYGSAGIYRDFQYIKNQLMFQYINLIYDFFIDNKNGSKDVFPKYKYDDGYHMKLVEIGDSDLPNYSQIFGRRLQEHLKQYQDDWVEVIPFDELYFLKATNGDYDFVFRNLKDKPFETGDTFFAPYLKHSDVPSSFNESYDFERWFYFGHKSKSDNLKKIEILELWEERDRELAKNKYLDATNSLKEYYTDIGKYQYMSNGDKDKPEFFKTVQIRNQEELHVSDIITIKELEEFLESNPEYRDTRHKNLDKLQPLNSEEDKSLPATVTWYDAVAYCKWIENQYDIPARLLTEEEYRLIHPYPNGCFENENYRKLVNRYEEDYHGPVRINNNGIFLNDVRFIEVPQLNSPDYRSDFNNLTLSYVRPLKYIQSKDNLSFCISPSFGEWLFDHYEGKASAILPYFMQSLYGDNDFYFDPKSSGKYKYRKIGFRICYVAKKDA